MWNKDRDDSSRPRSTGGDFRRRPFGGDERRSFPSRGGMGGGMGAPRGDSRGDSRGGDRGGDRGGFRKPEPRSHSVYIELLENASMPKYMTEESTGADITYSKKEDLVIKSFGIATVSTGIILQNLPPRLEAQVRARSSLAAKGLLLLSPTSATGEDKGQELVLTFINLSSESITLKQHERIAQLIFSFVQRVSVELNNNLGKTQRNEGGFGSTGNGDRSDNNNSRSDHRSENRSDSRSDNRSDSSDNN
jgi:dUTP pyrophosphatase